MARVLVYLFLVAVFLGEVQRSYQENTEPPNEARSADEKSNQQDESRSATDEIKTAKEEKSIKDDESRVAKEAKSSRQDDSTTAKGEPRIAREDDSESRQGPPTRRTMNTFSAGISDVIGHFRRFGAGAFDTASSAFGYLGDVMAGTKK